MRKLLEERDRRAKGTEVLASHTHTHTEDFTLYDGLLHSSYLHGYLSAFNPEDGVCA